MVREVKARKASAKKVPPMRFWTPASACHRTGSNSQLLVFVPACLPAASKAAPHTILSKLSSPRKAQPYTPPHTCVCEVGVQEHQPSHQAHHKRHHRVQHQQRRVAHCRVKGARQPSAHMKKRGEVANTTQNSRNPRWMLVVLLPSPSISLPKPPTQPYTHPHLCPQSCARTSQTAVGQRPPSAGPWEPHRRRPLAMQAGPPALSRSRCWAAWRGPAQGTRLRQRLRKETCPAGCCLACRPHARLRRCLRRPRCRHLLPPPPSPAGWCGRSCAWGAEVSHAGQWHPPALVFAAGGGWRRRQTQPSACAQRWRCLAGRAGLVAQTRPRLQARRAWEERGRSERGEKRHAGDSDVDKSRQTSHRSQPAGPAAIQPPITKTQLSKCFVVPSFPSQIDSTSLNQPPAPSLPVNRLTVRGCPHVQHAAVPHQHHLVQGVEHVSRGLVQRGHHHPTARSHRFQGMHEVVGGVAVQAAGGLVLQGDEEGECEVQGVWGG